MARLVSGSAGLLTTQSKIIFGVILAGGQGSRLGGLDKAFLRFGDRLLLDHVISRFAPQCETLAINSNDDPAKFEPYGLPILPDESEDRAGPLAGVLAGLTWAAKMNATHIVTVPIDGPFLPMDLCSALSPYDFAMSADRTGNLHPTFAIWPVALQNELREKLLQGERKMRVFAKSAGAVVAPFPDANPSPFFNINTSADLAEAEVLLGAE